MKRRYSKNKRAEKLLDKRDLPENAVPFDQPCELGYHCPVCDYPHIRKDGNWDERLHWSEYNGFLWCSVCNRDYPSCLCYNNKSEIPNFVYRVNPGCKTYIDLAIKTFLDTIENVGDKK
jgi:hypothetical protein